MVDFVELKSLARNTVGATNDYLLQEMGITIDIYNQLQSKVEEIEQQINDCVLVLDPPILTILLPEWNLDTFNPVLRNARAKW